MDRKEAVTILQEKRDLARKLEAAEKSADWAAKDRVDSSSLRASQHGRYADALDMAISALSQPNEPLTCDGCNMQGERVSPCSSCIRDPRVCDYYDRRPPEGVVRCRECKYWLGEHVCDLDCNHETHTGPDDFCSRGQRKEADHEVSGP